MKKLLIATVIAAAASTVAHAAPVTMFYDLELSGTITKGNGDTMGTTSGMGTAEIVIDIDDLSVNGLFTMTVVNTISNTSPIELSGIVTNVTTGIFDTLSYIATGEMNFIGGFADSITTECEDIKKSFFATICGQNPIGTESTFAIDAGSMTVTGPGDLVEFRETTISPDQPLVGDVTTFGDYTLTLDRIEPVNPVPVPAAAWLFGSALVGLAGIGRKRKAA